jgi:hypothetical protein
MLCCFFWVLLMSICTPGLSQTQQRKANSPAQSKYALKSVAKNRAAPFAGEGFNPLQPGMTSETMRAIRQQYAAYLAALPWKNKSHEERDASIALAWARHTSASRRHLQVRQEARDGLDGGDYDDLMEDLKRGGPYAREDLVWPGANSWCDDVRATNAGERTGCAYDCETLKMHYFPSQESRCFLYDAAHGGWPADLLTLRHTFSGANNTIIIPSDENWIVQGRLGPDGAPVALDARLSSGSSIDPSEAGVVARYVRFSGQRAAISQDPRDSGVPLYSNGEARSGGAFYYNGGGGDAYGQTLPALIFEQVIFDHNYAVDGGAISAEGRTDQVSAGVEVTIDGCLFFWNMAERRGGGATFHDFYPSVVAVKNSHFVHNQGFSQPQFDQIMSRSNPEYTTAGGQQHLMTFTNTHFQGPSWSWFPSMMLGFAMKSVAGDFDTGKEQVLNITFDHTSIADFSSHGGGLAAIWNYNPTYARLNVHVIDSHMTRVHSALPNGWPTSPLATNTLNLGYPGTCGPDGVDIARVIIEDCGALEDDYGTVGEGVLRLGGDGAMLARVTDSVFRRNRAATGAAIFVSTVTVELFLTRCSFIENIAIVSGGAIALMSPVGRYIVRDNTFLGNAVVPAPSTRALYVLRLRTSASGVGARSSPVWRLDGGPVFGVPFEECEKFRRISEAGVRGEAHPFNDQFGPPLAPLAPSWPDADCANVTFYQHNIYPHTLQLDQGRHRLQIGATLKDPLVAGWLGGAFVDIIDLGVAFSLNV